MSLLLYICSCGHGLFVPFIYSLVIEQNVYVELVCLGASIVLRSFLIVPCAYIG